MGVLLAGLPKEKQIKKLFVLNVYFGYLMAYT
jgi:hypothetical protein